MIHLSFGNVGDNPDPLELKVEQTTCENPWNINSIYEFQYFNCPCCSYKDRSKQEFVNHATQSHQECIEYLAKITDGSLDGFIWPGIKIKEDDHLDDYDEFDTTETEETEITGIQTSDDPKKLGDFKDEFQTNDEVEENIIDNRPSIECDICNERICLEVESEKTLSDLLDDHKEYYHNLKCKLCPKQFHTRAKLDRHISSCHSEHKCHQCDKTFSQKGTLTKHMKYTHEGGEKFHCSKCNLPFSSDSGRSKHESECQGVVYCEKCGKKFKHRETLLKHIKEKHSSSPKEYPCKQCDKVYNVYNSLYLHIRSIHGESMNAMCQHCGKKFYSNHHLNEHVAAIHEKSKNFKCLKCEKTFPTKKSRWLHSKYHEEKKFECDICFKKFAFKTILNTHVAGVHGDTKFGCDRCDKTFSHKQNLKAHIKMVHEGIQRQTFDCQFCNKCFRSKSLLQDHIEKTHL